MFNHSHRLLSSILGALLLGTASTAAQSPGNAGNGALTAATRRLANDATLPDSLRHLSVGDLVSARNTRYVGLLDDASAGLYITAMASTLHQVPDSACGQFFAVPSTASTDLEMMLPYLDSSSSAAWATILERLVHARAGGVSGGRSANAIEVKAAMLTMIGKLSAENQTRLITIARNPPPTPADGCWSSQTIMDGLAAMPVADLGPVVRAMFGAAPTGAAP